MSIEKYCLIFEMLPIITKTLDKLGCECKRKKIQEVINFYPSAKTQQPYTDFPPSFLISQAC